MGTHLSASRRTRLLAPRGVRLPAPRAARLALTYLLLLVNYAFILVPIVWIVLTSFKTNSAIFVGKVIPLPGDLTLSSYADVLQTPAFPTFFRNSAIIALGVTALTLVVSSLGAYGLSKYRTRGRRVLLMAILTSQTFPAVLILVPFYTFVLQVHLNDTYLGIILAQTSGALPFCMWTLKSYMDAVPVELVEASLIDGCSKVGTYLRIVLPTSLPGLAVAGFYAFIVSWGDYLFVSVISGSNSTATLPIYLYRISSSLVVNWGTIAATTVLAILPVVAVFAFVQRWLIEGLLAGAVKG